METAPDFLALLLTDLADDSTPVVEPATAPIAPKFVCVRCKTCNVVHNSTVPGAPGRRGKRGGGPKHWGVCFFCDGGVRETRLLKIG